MVTMTTLFGDQSRYLQSRIDKSMVKCEIGVHALQLFILGQMLKKLTLYEQKQSIILTCKAVQMFTDFASHVRTTHHRQNT